MIFGSRPHTPAGLPSHPRQPCSAPLLACFLPRRRSVPQSLPGHGRRSPATPPQSSPRASLAVPISAAPQSRNARSHRAIECRCRVVGCVSTSTTKPRLKSWLETHGPSLKTLSRRLRADACTHVAAPGDEGIRRHRAGGGRALRRLLSEDSEAAGLDHIPNAIRTCREESPKAVASLSQAIETLRKITVRRATESAANPMRLTPRAQISTRIGYSEGGSRRFGSLQRTPRRPLAAASPSCQEESRERPLRKVRLYKPRPFSGGSLPPRQPFAAAGPVVPPRSLNHCHTKTLHGFGCFAEGETEPRSRTKSVSEGQFPRNRWSPVFRSCLGPQSVSLREQSWSLRGMPVRLLAAVRNTLVVSHRLPNGNPTTTPRKEPRPEITYVLGKSNMRSGLYLANACQARFRCFENNVGHLVEQK